LTSPSPPRPTTASCSDSLPLPAPALSHLPSFPTRRSSDLARTLRSRPCFQLQRGRARQSATNVGAQSPQSACCSSPGQARMHKLDRKSTRLNSSHEWISYAVFCLTKKKHSTQNDDSVFIRT